MNVLKFEAKMREKGLSLIGTTMRHNSDVYKILDVIESTDEMILLYGGRRVPIRMRSWNVTDIKWSLSTGFYWRMT